MVVATLGQCPRCHQRLVEAQADKLIDQQKLFYCLLEYGGRSILFRPPSVGHPPFQKAVFKNKCVFVVFLQEQRSLKAGDVSQQESRSAAVASMKLTTADGFSAERVARAAQEQRETVTPAGRFNHAAAAAQSKLTISNGMTGQQTSVTKSAVRKSELSIVSSSSSHQVRDVLSFNNTTLCDVNE